MLMERFLKSGGEIDTFALIPLLNESPPISSSYQGDDKEPARIPPPPTSGAAKNELPSPKPLADDISIRTRGIDHIYI